MDVAVDLVVLAMRNYELNILLVQRGEGPFIGQWALPGGGVKNPEKLVVAARRELREETGVGPVGHLEQVEVYDAPDRDPRGRVISVAYLALIADPSTPTAGTDAAHASWWPVHAAPRLAFDHDQILHDGLERARSRLEHTPLATVLCAREFTLGQLEAVYAAVWDTDLDRRNFRRSALRTRGFLRPTNKRRVGQFGAPAQHYTRGDADTLHPTIRRPKLPRVDGDPDSTQPQP